MPQKDEMRHLKDEVQKPKDRIHFWKDEKFTPFAEDSTLSKASITN